MRRVVVTGGTRGIGLGIVRALVRDAYHVIAIGRTITPELGEVMAAAGPGGACSFLSWDLLDISHMGRLAATLRSEYGNIYGLVNNAGIGTPGILVTMPDRDLVSLVQMNVLSPLALTKHVAKSMMAAGGGRVVNVSSIVARTGYPGLAVYSATKAALEGFTRSYAREVGGLGITVNAVAPGFIETSMTSELDERQRAQIKRRSALHRMASVEDVAEAVAFLVSDKAANITGTVLTVDAGNTA